jgi:hypothetical protein
MKKECDTLTKKVAELVDLILTTESDYKDDDPILFAKDSIDAEYLDKLTQKHNQLLIKVVFYTF